MPDRRTIALLHAIRGCAVGSTTLAVTARQQPDSPTAIDVFSGRQDEALTRGRPPMDRDFVYCPGCSRYSIVLWRRDVGAWECEDCACTLPSDGEDSVWTAPETLAS
jgi:hypothetical protein